MQKPIIRIWLIPVAAITLVVFVLGLRGGHPISHPVHLIGAPKSLNQLINHEGRRYGDWVNQEDRFYYVGDAVAFATFLDQYANVSPIAGYKLTLHDGPCTGFRPCDWLLEVGRVSWRERSSRPYHRGLPHPIPPWEEPEYLAEVHLWLESNVSLIPLEIPPMIHVAYRTQLEP